jgi:hypothetical protein
MDLYLIIKIENQIRLLMETKIQFKSLHAKGKQQGNTPEYLAAPTIRQ